MAQPKKIELIAKRQRQLPVFMVLKALNDAGNVDDAAAALQVATRTLRTYMFEHGIIRREAAMYVQEHEAVSS